MAGPLEDREARQVLRYWLGALRHEESLASRPRAHRAGDATDPTSSQPYFRLGSVHGAFWTTARGEASAAMEPGLERFLRHFLRRAGRRSEARPVEWVAGWPAVFFQRRDEIATLFRFPVRLEWRRGGAPWEVAGRRDSPDAVVVRASLESDDDEPTVLSIDRALLQDTLGLLADEIAELEARWRGEAEPTTILADLLRALDPDSAAAGPAAPGERFQRVVEAVRRRLPHGVSVYPTGIIQDGSLVFATYQLQRELAELAALPPGASPLMRGTALWSYLTGAPAEPERALLRARFRSRGLTASQRSAAELALGSRLAAVQGPPGTGKTELIQSLAAHALVERIEGWQRGRPMREGLMVVTSTNNRAVENAIDPLGVRIEDERLPLALRGGNQEVTRSITARELGRAIAWLSAQSAAGALDRLEEARGAFHRASEELRALTATQAARLRRESRLRELRRLLAALPPDPGPEAVALHDGLRALRLELSKMVQSARARKTKVDNLQRRWQRAALQLVAPLLPLRPGLAMALGLPPAGEGQAATRTAWREALEEALEEIDEALAPLGAEQRTRVAARRATLTSELGELESLTEVAPALDAATEREIEARAHALFLRAVETRERWAIANGPALLADLEKARKAALELRTLRHVMAEDDGPGNGLRALYPVVGCTLLSLGNVFRHAPGEIDALVVDEAGQCHPAYPVGGLARARRALLIGDVQQLPPVVAISERDEARLRRAARVTLDAARLAPFVIHDLAGTSAQALADRAVQERPTLVDHFRCQREIIALSDELCAYRLTVHTPLRSLSATMRRLAAPVLFDHVRGEQARARGSWANDAEAERLADLLIEMRRAGLPLSEVGVLTPYVGQLELLRQLLRRRGIPLEASGEEMSGPHAQVALPGAEDLLSIGTVHRFQGGERSVILLSTVITREHDLAFLDARVNLLNVAISRARDHLVTFGNEEVLRAGRFTRLLVERAGLLR
jgi:hypothetical protein